MTHTEDFLNKLKPALQNNWEASGFKAPTTIQEKAIPPLLEGKDVIAESPTGTGKTLAYLLPVLNAINEENGSIQALILASSHELVMQINEEIQKWSKGSKISGASFIGGANLKRQLEKLKKRPQVVAGTPGRINELIKQKKMKMHEVKTIVLDEGDQLLVPEHIGTIQNIVKSTLKDRQVVLFSATLPPQIEAHAKKMMSEPELVIVKREENIPSKVEHVYITADPRDKIKILEKISRLDSLKGLAFVKDIGSLSVLSERLEYNGVPHGVLHGESNKRDREASIKGLRTGEYSLLLATEVAARGLDVKGLTHVIHFDLPKTKEQYIHRSGRTGRSGAEGTVISIIAPNEERDLKRLARDLNLEIQPKTFYKGEISDIRSAAKPVIKNRK
ncbi:superfamily II DNA/RNA helicase [Peribacillus deserti]|uniref:Superfamily II DNA/RNA helicase n=1 Tax=Peribacillus deserti TaxID=673318 RepID=A0ABS2QL02_9BACI|nr:DEAD/DEAH box helicase [Peribacillus deserti]MBM7693690.1 superfamily II DNA/RNA helicase [Peribacillus deserti]